MTLTIYTRAEGWTATARNVKQIENTNKVRRTRGHLFISTRNKKYEFCKHMKCGDVVCFMCFFVFYPVRVEINKCPWKSSMFKRYLKEEIIIFTSLFDIFCYFWICFIFLSFFHVETEVGSRLLGWLSLGFLYQIRDPRVGRHWSRNWYKKPSESCDNSPEPCWYTWLSGRFYDDSCFLCICKKSQNHASYAPSFFQFLF